MSESESSANSHHDGAATDAELDADLAAWLGRWLTRRSEAYSAAAARGDTDTVAAPTWVEAMVKQMGADVPAGLSDAIRAILFELRAGLLSLRDRPRVAFLGPEFTYSHLAALRRFGAAAEFVPVNSIADVFEELSLGRAEYGLAPLENSTDGRISDTLTCFARAPQKICGEVRVPIHHNLMSNSAMEEIQVVCSKPQALSQCREWLTRHLPNARREATESTTAAAMRAAKEPGCAAIASREAASAYSVGLLAEQIEDRRNNVTRFAVIGARSAERTGADKCSIMFELPHKPGVLADALQLFKSCELNLTWIESFPLPDREAEYLFFVEVEGHEQDALVARAIEQLAKAAVRFEVLGSYPRDAVGKP